MRRDSSRTPEDKRFQIQATIVMGVFGAVIGFILTMTSQGFSPYEAIGVIVMAGSATGVITRVLLDVLSSFNTSRVDKPERPDEPATLKQPTNESTERLTEGSTNAGPEIPAQPQPDDSLPQPTEEVADDLPTA